MREINSFGSMPLPMAKQRKKPEETKKPSPYRGVQINLRLPPELLAEVDRVAEEMDRSRNNAIVQLLKQSIAEWYPAGAVPFHRR